MLSLPKHDVLFGYYLRILFCLSMCRDCFLQEPRGIAHGPEWMAFHAALANKVALGQLLQGEYVVDYLRGNQDATQAYTCAGCAQRWWVREPWYPYKSAWEKGVCVMERLAVPVWAKLFARWKRHKKVVNHLSLRVKRSQ